jgi:hypothetical protein
MPRERGAPGVERAGCNAEGDVARAVGAVRRHAPPLAPRVGRSEEEKDRVALRQAKRRAVGVDRADGPEPEDVDVEARGGHDVVRVEHRLVDVADRHRPERIARDDVAGAAAAMRSRPYTDGVERESVPIVARLAPELRRSALYALAVPVMVAVVGVLAPPPVGMVKALVAAGGLGVAWLLLVACAYTFRIELDADGVRRRRLWLVDRFRAEEFRSGAMRADSSQTFRAASRGGWRDPLGRRTLTLGSLAMANAKAISERLAAWLPPNPPTPLVDVAEVRVGFTTYRLDRSGVRVCKGGVGVGPLVAWRDVAPVVVERDDRRILALRALSWTMPAHLLGAKRRRASTVQLRHHRGRPLWTGTGPHELASFVDHHVPADVVVDVSFGPPRSAEEYQYRRAAILRHMRDLRQLVGIVAVLTAALVVTLAWSRPVLAALGFTLLFLIPYVALMYSFARRNRAALADLDREWAAHSDETPTTATA